MRDRKQSRQCMSTNIEIIEKIKDYFDSKSMFASEIWELLAKIRTIMEDSQLSSDDLWDQLNDLLKKSNGLQLRKKENTNRKMLSDLSKELIDRQKARQMLIEEQEKKLNQTIINYNLKIQEYQKKIDYVKRQLEPYINIRIRDLKQENESLYSQNQVAHKKVKELEDKVKYLVYVADQNNIPLSEEYLSQSERNITENQSCSLFGFIEIEESYKKERLWQREQDNKKRHSSQKAVPRRQTVNISYPGNDFKKKKIRQEAEQNDKQAHIQSPQHSKTRKQRLDYEKERQSYKNGSKKNHDFLKKEKIEKDMSQDEENSQLCISKNEKEEENINQSDNN